MDHILIANYLTHNWENISVAILELDVGGNQSFYVQDRELLLWVGELADGFGLWSEETPPTMLNCSACKGVGREPWFLSRNGTSSRGMRMMRLVSLMMRLAAVKRLSCRVKGRIGVDDFCRRRG